MKKILLLLVSHILALAVGIALGIYALPILTAPTAPTNTHAASAASKAAYTGSFRRNLKGSDALHWGDGIVSVGSENIVLVGKLAPGPDYKLYLSPTFVETEADFVRLKSQMKLVGDVRTFDNFVVAVPNAVDVSQYKAVIIWCESFSQFISATQYR